MEEMKKFLSSIYLGDRFCESITVESHKISFQINLISRLKRGSKEWNYYSEEDIEHGHLVFDEVIDYTPISIPFFNDEIYAIEVTEKVQEIYTFIIKGCYVSDTGISTDQELQIRAKDCYIYNPQNNRIITK